MNRREFLTGLAAFGTSVAIPPAEVIAEISVVDWQAALAPIYSQYLAEFMVFGSAAIAETETFPFVRNVPREEWMAIPELFRSTGDSL